MDEQHVQNAGADASSTYIESPERPEKRGGPTVIMAESLHRRTDTHASWISDETIQDFGFDMDLPFWRPKKSAIAPEYTVEMSDGDMSGVSTPGTGDKQYLLVTFLPNDPENPRNWSRLYKWYCTIVAALTFSVVAFSSSIITADISNVSEEFGVSELVGLLSFSVFVLGFGSGPMVFSPLSEVYGRRWIYAITLFLATAFMLPCALANNFTTLIICRTIDGIVFSAPLTLCGGTIADLWKTEERGVPMAAFSAAPFIGLIIGPLVGGFVSDAAGWRWLYWSQLFAAGVASSLITFTVPETYAPTILARRARKLRETSGEKHHVTEQDLDVRPFAERIRIFLVRPFQLLFGELIVFLVSAYVSILFGLLYMFFVAYPIVYKRGKHYSASTTGLMFIPTGVGILLSAACAPLVNRHYLRLCTHYPSRNPPAEIRLIPMMISCWAIPIGLFIFAWTSFPSMSWVGPAMSGFVVGFGFIFLYNSANNYLVDSYQHQAASALAAQTLLRSLWGAGVVLFTRQMYFDLGYQWASSVLAFISLAFCAVPFVFYYRGAEIRRRSKYAFSGEDEEIAGEMRQA